MTSTQTAKRAKKTTMPPILADISAVKLVPLDLIDTLPQLRKEFDQVSIEDLAEDIKIRGLLQPVLLNPTGDRYEMIAGERRLRAVKHNGATGIPALLVKASPDEAMLMQLAENIQRENLSLEEECQAIKRLYEFQGSLDKVAETVKKSKPWCSKRFAMAQNGLWYGATKLIEEGVTEDIELLKALTNLEKITGWAVMQEWLEKIRKGEAGRNEIRAALKVVKQQVKENKEKEAAKTEKVSHAKPKKAPPPWTIETSMERLSEALTYCDGDKIAIDMMNSWDEEKRIEVEKRLDQMAATGAKEGGFKLIAQLVMNGLYNTPYYDIDLMAMIAGYRSNAPLNMTDFLADLQTPSETA